ncbi:DUF3572 domain-containing protein [Parvibaculum sp.]|uniref:DUF3572 domain-containing protein n=1 Tax=Parvibaculum sp. TaxID=2024848 RepID=UPI0034A09AF0
MDRDNAEMLAIHALGHIAADEELLGDFLDRSGLAPDELRARAADAEFLGFVLEYLLNDEPRLLAFCADAGLAPELPAAARRALPGGEEVHWS